MLLSAALAEHSRERRGERRDVRLRAVPPRHAADSRSTLGRRTCRRVCGLSSLTLTLPLLPGALLVVLIVYLDESSQIPAERYVAYPSRLFASGAVGTIVAVTGVAYAAVLTALATSHRTPAASDMIGACRARAQARRAAQLAAWHASLGDIHPTEREAHVWVSAYETKVAEAWIAPARLLWTVLQLPAIAYAALLVVAHSEELWEWCYAHAPHEARCTVPYLTTLLPSTALWGGEGSAMGLPELLLLRLAAMVLGCVYSLGASLAALCLGGRGLLQSARAQCIGHTVVRRVHAAAWALSYTAVLCFDTWFNWSWILTVRLECSLYVDVPANATGVTPSSAPTATAPTSSSWYGYTPTGYPTALPTPAIPDGGEMDTIPSGHVAYDAWRACRWYASTTQLLLYVVALIHLVRWLRFFASMPAVFTPDSIRTRSEMFRRHAVLQCVYERACCCTPRFVAAQLREEWARVQEHARTRGRRFDAEDSAWRTPRAIVEFEANTSMRHVLAKWRKRRPFGAIALTLALRVDAMLGASAFGGGEGRSGADGRVAPLNEWTGMGVGAVELLVIHEREERERAAREAATVRVYRASEQEEALQSQVDALLRRVRSQSEVLTGAARMDVAAAAVAAATRSVNLPVATRVVEGDVEEGRTAVGTARADEYFAEGPAAAMDDVPIAATVETSPGSPHGLSLGRALSPSATARDVDTLAIPSNFLCPITHDIMAHPVVLVGDGYSYVGTTALVLSTDLLRPHFATLTPHIPTRWRIILNRVSSHRYEHSAISYWLSSHSSSPMTNCHLSPAECATVPNRALTSAIAQWRDRLLEIHTKE